MLKALDNRSRAWTPCTTNSPSCRGRLILARKVLLSPSLNSCCLSQNKIDAAKCKYFLFFHFKICGTSQAWNKAWDTFKQDEGGDKNGHCLEQLSLPSEVPLPWLINSTIWRWVPKLLKVSFSKAVSKNARSLKPPAKPKPAPKQPAKPRESKPAGKAKAKAKSRGKGRRTKPANGGD